jgi:enamine deaminase RidA (YjgF/YER057c/UK114 family)
MGVNVTDWGDAMRLDLNQLGASLPDVDGNGETWSEETSQALRNSWSEAQNLALCDAMTAAAGEIGGDFRSFVEWTVLHNKLYDGTHMRDIRRERLGPDHRAAITTLGWSHPEATVSTCIQAVGYIPKGKGDFKQEVWQPECLYDTEFMALAPTVVTTFGGARQIHISGLVAWDNETNPLHVGDPVGQIAHVFELIEEIFKEAGGSLACVTRLRPFAHSTEIAGLIRDRIVESWNGIPRPSVMMSDSRSFGNPPKLYTEIQVMGVLPDSDSQVDQKENEIPASLPDQDCIVVRSSIARDWEMLHVAEVRPSSKGDPAEEAQQVTAGLKEVMEAQDLTRDDVCLILAYASSLEGAKAFTNAATELVDGETLHILPCPDMPELNGRSIKAEMTARKLK